MLKKLKSFLILGILILCLIYTFIHSDIIIKDVIEALNIFTTKLFPAMFFFYTLSDLLINYGFIKLLEILFNPLFLKVFHLSGSSSFIVIMSMLSGFPSGAKYTTSFLEKKIIDQNQANYLLTFTHFSNPLFMMGTIAVIFSKKAAFLALICHYTANFILAFLIRPKKIKKEEHPPAIERDSFSNTLAKSFLSSFKTLLLILGNTIFFYTLSDIMTSNLSSSLLNAIIYGFFDLTKGILSIKNLHITLFFQLLLITSFLSFGGISVHFQVKEIIAKEKLNYFYFLLGRISSLAIAIFLLIILFAIGIV